MPTIEESLRTLRDVEGVFGSFVFSGAGTLVSKDLPEVFDDAVLAEVGPRITRLYETFASGGDELETVMLRYFEHKLFVRKMAWGVLGILSGTQVNLPALRMVGNLVARRIDPEVASTVSRAPSPPSSRTPPPPVVAHRAGEIPPPPSAIAQRSVPPALPQRAPVQAGAEVREGASPKSVRMYRGRRIEE